jgi:tetratricopeptide (TPR) repeat protein
MQSVMAFALFLPMAAGAVEGGNSAPQFNEKGELLFPADYREWVYLSSGIGMTYGPAAAIAMDNPMFDNVYVNPKAFAAFKETGTWPDGTMFVLEIRYSTTNGSINKGGFYQTDVAAIEAAVKDTKRFPRAWGYFNFRGGMRAPAVAAAPLGANAGCNACHEPNGAVENTFTQFYPTALAIAESKGTVKPSYKPPVGSPARLFHLIREKKSTPQEVLAQARTQDPAAPVLKENTLNFMGYNLLQAGDREQAIAVFQWNVASYPQSANAQDSLAEALEEAGRKEEARKASERALHLIDADPAMTGQRKELIRKASQERVARLSK